MLSLQRCKQILQRNGSTYSNDEVERIRNLLYQLGHIEYDLFIQHTQSEKGRPLHTRLDR